MSDSTSRINTAVDECLDRCLRSRSPDATLAAYISNAVGTGSLTQEEANVVEATVKRILRERSEP